MDKERIRRERIVKEGIIKENKEIIRASKVRKTIEVI